MSHDLIRARNRANAQRSTGPRTAAGKAAVSRNALRHGATSRPDGRRVLTWMAIILDDPEVLRGLPLAPDARTLRARALAEAEARLEMAEAAVLRDGEGDREGQLEMSHFIDLIDDAFEGLDVPKELRLDGILLRARLAKQIDKDEAAQRSRSRILLRYLAEARSRHRRALDDWVAFALEARGLPS